MVFPVGYEAHVIALKDRGQCLQVFPLGLVQFSKEVWVSAWQPGCVWGIQSEKRTVGGRDSPLPRHLVTSDSPVLRTSLMPHLKCDYCIILW